MSGFGIVESLLTIGSEYAFLRTRSIGGLIPNVTLEETSVDEIRITDHPVERGSPITDHFYKLPPTVVMRVGWSNSTSVLKQLASQIESALMSGGEATAGFFGVTLSQLSGPDYVRGVYDALLAMQVSGQLLSITTGKRKYTNMLIQRVSVVTDEKSENALLAVCECRQIQIADVSVVGFPASSAQSSPELTNPATNVGQVNTGTPNITVAPGPTSAGF